MSTDQQTKISVDVARCEQLLSEIVRIRSVVGEPTTAHLWVSSRLRELGMTVEHYAVEGRRRIRVPGRQTARMGELTRHGRSVTPPRPLTRYYICSKRRYSKQSNDQPFSIAHKSVPLTAAQ